MTIVANTDMLNFFRRIPIFKLDLGRNLIDLKQEKLHLSDGFMLKYFSMTGKQILTYGTIGKLKFYQDFTLPQKEFVIFNDESIYGLIFSKEDAKMSPENYLASIVKEINEKEGIKETQEIVVPKRDPDIKLPADQYIQEMIKKRKQESDV